AGEAGAHPAPVAVPERLAAELGGDAAGAEQLRVPAHDPRIDDPARRRVAHELRAAAAEDDVNAGPRVGGEKGPSCVRDVTGGGIVRRLREAGRDLAGPAAVEVVAPV